MPGAVADVPPATALSIDADGAALHAGAALPIVPGIERALADAPRGRAGVRIHDNPVLAGLLHALSVAAIARARVGAAARPVRATLFDKSAAANWGLGCHQDRTIAVTARRDVPGYGPWSVKAGVQHVEPPFAVIAAMVTLRIHLDDVPADNAPLLISPRSHRLGRIGVADVAAIVERLGAVACLARRGDVWAYATPVLHASARSRGGRRRVLQVDYSADRLPGGLAWCGI